VVHRDLKPENLFVTSLGGEADFMNVLDFGIAKVVEPDDDAGELTADAALLGTPASMAPERARGDAVDARSDVCGLGAVLWYALTGQKVFPAPSLSALLMKHAYEAPRPVPAALEALALRCLAKDPAERCADGRRRAVGLAEAERELGER